MKGVYGRVYTSWVINRNNRWKLQSGRFWSNIRRNLFYSSLDPIPFPLLRQIISTVLPSFSSNLQSLPIYCLFAFCLQIFLSHPPSLKNPCNHLRSYSPLKLSSCIFPILLKTWKICLYSLPSLSLFSFPSQNFSNLAFDFITQLQLLSKLLISS